MSGKHRRDDKPQRPNDILDVGAAPAPEGVELAVVVRLEDAAYKVSKIFTPEEFDYILEGMRVCAQTVAYKQRPVPKREVPAAPAPGPGQPVMLPHPPAAGNLPTPPPPQQ